MESDCGCAEADKGWRGQALETARLILRPPGPEDADRLVELLDDIEVARWLDVVPHPYTRAHALEWTATIPANLASGTDFPFLMQRRTDGQVVGAVGIHRHDDGFELGYWLGRAFWGQGYATEAARRMVRFAFVNLEAEQVTSNFLPGNAGSERVLGKTGLRTVGKTDAGAGRCKGVERDKLAISREDWLKLQAEKPRLLVAAAALVDSQNRVLMATRPPGKTMSGLWEFPGGKVDAGESPEAALVRELKEELDLDVCESCLHPLSFASHDYDSFHLLMPLYVCRVWTGKAEPQEGQEIRWVRPNELLRLPMPPADIPLVAALQDAL